MEQVRAVDVSAFTIPTDGPESDGTMAWDSTTMVVVELAAGDHTGLGYTYGETAVAQLVRHTLAPVVEGTDVGRRAGTWHDMRAALRNAGRPGIGMMAVSAVDVALWDLQAKLLGTSVADLTGGAHVRVPIYGSGGFCTYSLARLAEQTAGWVAQGIPRVKVKTSRHPGEDPVRLDAVRRAIGDETALYCDANGALTRKDALAWAERMHRQWDVRWLEEPVSSDDLEGLRLVRDRGPAGLDVAAGEYGFILSDFHRLLAGGCVDCLQADVTRCGGITGVLVVAGLCATHQLDLSAHGAPAISAHAFCGVHRLRHLEHFYDHTRIESMAFDGTLDPAGGFLEPDRDRPGLGLELRRPDLEQFRVR